MATEITFTAGSVSGERECVTITALSDGVIESDEQFSVCLTSDSSGMVQIEEGRGTQSITLLDVDGKVLN